MSDVEDLLDGSLDGIEANADIHSGGKLEIDAEGSEQVIFVDLCSSKDPYHIMRKLGLVGDVRVVKR